MSALNFQKVTPGTTLNLSKDFGNAVSGILTFNLNWGMINNRAVDLDAILVTKSGGVSGGVTNTVTKKPGFFKKLLGAKDEVTTEVELAIKAGVKDTFYFGNKHGVGVKHHGDDLTGADAEGEYIEVNLDKLPSDVTELVFSVISFSGHSFADLPFASIEVFTGSPNSQGRGLVSMELTGFQRDTKSLVLAKVSKNANGEWEVTGLSVEGKGRSVSSATSMSASV